MPNLNEVLLIGHVGKDPVVRQTANSQVASFSLATNKSRKKADGTWDKTTTWHNVVAWGWLAEVVAEQFRKGDGVIVWGRIETRSWDSAEGKKYITEIIAEDAYKLVAHAREPYKQKGSNQDTPAAPSDDHDLPF